MCAPLMHPGHCRLLPARFRMVLSGQRERRGPGRRGRIRSGGAAGNTAGGTANTGIEDDAWHWAWSACAESAARARRRSAAASCSEGHARETARETARTAARQHGASAAVSCTPAARSPAIRAGSYAATQHGCAGDACRACGSGNHGRSTGSATAPRSNSSSGTLGRSSASGSRTSQGYRRGRSRLAVRSRCAEHGNFETHVRSCGADGAAGGRRESVSIRPRCAGHAAGQRAGRRHAAPSVSCTQGGRSGRCAVRWPAAVSCRAGATRRAARCQRVDWTNHALGHARGGLVAR